MQAPCLLLGFKEEAQHGHFRLTVSFYTIVLLVLTPPFGWAGKVLDPLVGLMPLDPFIQ